jgi:hypothetical protein
MKIGFFQTARSRANMTCGAAVLALVYNGALGAEIFPDSLKIAAGVIKADGYETPPAKGTSLPTQLTYSAVMRFTEPTSPGNSRSAKRWKSLPR